ncbi:MAG: hypothetical protein NVS3B3_16360 [Aquirhabdus sp.]
MNVNALGSRQLNIEPNDYDVTNSIQAITSNDTVNSQSSIVTLSSQGTAANDDLLYGVNGLPIGAGFKLPSLPSIGKSSFGCIGGGADGLVAGLCLDGRGNIYAYVGGGTPGLSVTAGTVNKGTTSDYLNGLSCSINNIPTRVGFAGIGISPNGGDTATAAVISNAPGASCTIGFTLGNVSNGNSDANSSSSSSAGGGGNLNGIKLDEE